jgi:hypothetical protein
MSSPWLAVLILLSFLPATPRANAFVRQETKTHLRVNQLGYRTRDAKVAVAFSDGELPARFAVVAAGTGRGRTLPRDGRAPLPLRRRTLRAPGRGRVVDGS